MQNLIKRKIDLGTVDATVNTVPLNVEEARLGAVEVAWAEGSSADFSAQVEQRINEVWHSVGSAIAVNSAAGSGLITMDYVHGQDIRVAITRTDGEADIVVTKYFKH